MKSIKYLLVVLLLGAGGWLIFQSLHGPGEQHDVPVEPIYELPPPSGATKKYRPLPVNRQRLHRQIASTVSNPKQDLLSEKMETILALKNCYTSQDCDFENSDPKSYDYAIGQAIKLELKDLIDYTAETGLVDPRLNDLAKELLSVPDGHVKEPALALLSTQPPDPSTLPTLFEEVLEFHNPYLIPYALAEFAKYKGSQEEPLIHQKIAETMTHGSLLVREALASGISHTLSNSNLSTYKRALSQLPNNSQAFKDLKAAIDQFELSRAGG